MKNITIESSIECDINISMNPHQLQRLIDNTISNAIKYSYEKSVIELSLCFKGEYCYLSFKDYGVGIENVEKIFSRYYRENSDKGGFGIGLNIVKSIIDSVGIKLEIDSKRHLGSTFRYKFPLDIVQIKA
jgi:signal transduction histidine kinase